MVATSCLRPSLTRWGQLPGVMSPDIVRPRADHQLLLEASYVGFFLPWFFLTDALAVQTLPSIQQRSSLCVGSTRVVLPPKRWNRAGHAWPLLPQSSWKAWKGWAGGYCWEGYDQGRMSGQMDSANPEFTAAQPKVASQRLNRHYRRLLATPAAQGRVGRTTTMMP